MKKVLTNSAIKQIPIKYVFGYSGDFGASRKYYNAQWQVHCEVHTKRKKAGDLYSGWHPEQRAYYVTYDDRVFKSVDELWDGVFATPWFKLSEHKPVRNGHYETDAGLKFWDGAAFHTGDVVTIWRGLNKVPYDKHAE